MSADVFDEVETNLELDATAYEGTPDGANEEDNVDAL